MIRRAGPAIAALGAMLAAGCGDGSGAAYLVRNEHASLVVSLFGPSWSGPTGALHLIDVRLGRTAIHAELAAPGMAGELVLAHVAPGAASDDGATSHPPATTAPLLPLATRPGADLAVAAACTGCDEPSRAALIALAERMVASYPANPAEGLFTEGHGLVVGRERAVAWWLSGLLWLALLGITIYRLLGWLTREPASSRSITGSPTLTDEEAALPAPASTTASALTDGEPGSRPGPIAALRDLLRGRHGELAFTLVAGAATIVAALVLDRPGPANWYANLLPARGWDTELLEHNGVASFLVEGVVRSLFGWSDRVLFGFHLLVGGAAAALAFSSLRVLGADRFVALTACLVTAVLPQWSRAIFSDAQHGLVALLFFALLHDWARATTHEHTAKGVTGRPLHVATSLLLVVLLPLVRSEALVLVLLPPLLTFRPGLWPRRPGLGHQLLLLIPYAAAVALAALAVEHLFIRRFAIPTPPLADSLARFLDPGAVAELFRSLVSPVSPSVSWLPRELFFFGGLGAVVLLVTRPSLLLRITLAFIVSQLLLARHLNAEGLVGARYFLPLFPLLARIIASPNTAREYGIGTRHHHIPPISAAIYFIAIGLFTFPIHHLDYTFQDEYWFLRRELGQIPLTHPGVPGGARVFYPTVRDDDHLRRDPDCCLDLARSPLPLAFPDLAFEPLPLVPEAPRFPERGGDEYYFESALCSLAPTDETEGHNPGLAEVTTHVCDGLTAGASGSIKALHLVAKGTASPEGTWPFFTKKSIPLRLYRIER